MRVLIATLLILAVFVVSTFMLDQYIDRSCEELLENIKVLSKSIENNEWNEAKDELSDLKEKWVDTKKRWQLFLEHYEMDAIDIAIARLDQYVKIEDRSQALGEIAEIRFLISHIREKEKVKLENIF